MTVLKTTKTREKCFPHFEVNPDPGYEGVKKIAEAEGLSNRTVYRALEDWRVINNKTNGTSDDVQSKKGSGNKKPPAGNKKNKTNEKKNKKKKKPPGKQRQCYPFFKIKPFPNSEEMQKIAEQVGLATRSAYRAFANYRKLHPEIYEGMYDLNQGSRVIVKKKHKENPEKYKKLRTKKDLNPEGIDIWSLPDDELKKLFREFVGYIDDDGTIHKGEAVPEPVDEITEVYMGITDYQVDFILTYRDYFNLLMIWFRGAGKTWVITWIIQFVMKYRGEKVLYFSLTDVAFTVANWVYIWAENNDAVVDTSTVISSKKVSGRRSTYQKFSLINGARFEVHQIRTSSTLGYHGWVIIMDDVIDEQHKRLPHLQKALQMKCDHQYFKIRRIKLVFLNTRKFAGDFFDWVIDQFEKKSMAYASKRGKAAQKYTLLLDLKTPYTECQFSGNIDSYRTFIRKLEKKQIRYDPLNVLAPWYTPEDFEAMKLENLKSFHAEMMGNPRPLEGGNWQREDLRFLSHFEQFDYEAICISIDPAWSLSETADASGIIIQGLKEKLFQGRRQYTVFKAFEKKMKAKAWKETDKFGKEIIHEGLLDFIEEQFKWVKVNFTQVRQIIVVFETNSGGQILIDIARAESDNYSFAGHIIDDSEIAFTKMEKVERIDTELYDCIKNGDMEFMDYLDDSILIDQILTFPDCKTDHAIDALGKGKFALHRMKRADVAGARARTYQIARDIREKMEQEIIEEFERKGIAGIRQAKETGRVMFDNEYYS